jgi:hypothetical protein
MRTSVYCAKGIFYLHYILLSVLGLLAAYVGNLVIKRFNSMETGKKQNHADVVSSAINSGILYEVIVYARRYGMAGATVIKGIMGYRASSSISSTRFLSCRKNYPWSSKYRKP